MENNQTNEKLLAEIDRLKKELKKKKKYGLVWEDKPEDVVEMCKEKLPVLKEIKSKEIITDINKPVNLLIEGDNYHALSVLNYTHKGKIDVIYIDPPYNTGNKSWKYNNQYVEKDDSFIHSKWISFMSKRLKIAKNLLKNEGILMVAVDDYECHTLRFLIDEIYGENNRLGTIVVVHNPGGRSDDRFIATSHEYLLVYGKNKDLSKINFLPLTPEQIEEYKFQDNISRYKLQSFMRTGSNSRPEDRPKLYYPIYFNENENTLSLKKENNDFIQILPISSDGQKRVWRWGTDTFNKNKETEFTVNKNRNKITIQVKKRFQGNGDDGSKPKTFWQDPKYNASSHGTILLQNILRKEKPFNYPKSLYAVVDALVISTNKKSIVLDYFAGSGTTGHAVMELNKRDGGSRQFILCTNNESEICENVCYPRIKNVVNGYKNKKDKLITGLGGNLKYFKTDFVNYKESTDKNKIKLTKEAVEMLCVKEGTFESVLDNGDFKIFKSQDHYAGVIFDQLAIKDFKKAIKDIKGKISVYIFSLGDDSFEGEFEDIKQKVKLSPIPEAILKVYRRINK